MKKSTVILTLTLTMAFCFALVSAVQAGPDDAKVPIWQITQEGTAKAVKWVNAVNSRFAVYDAGTAGDESDDIVLDRETGLVWARNANIMSPRSWEDAVIDCRNLNIGNRKGWRLPTVEELASLVDPSQLNPPLPIGHPFQNVVIGNYYSSTTYEDPSSDRAWYVNMNDGEVDGYYKPNDAYVWPVRGGSGPVLVPHTPLP